MEFDDFWRDLKRLRAAQGRQTANLIAWRTVPSSHQTARRLVREYCSEESLPPQVDIVAFEQSAGQGREGRSWSSPPAAGVYASLVRLIPSGLLARLPLLVPVALAEALGGVTGGLCRIKWPNDLVISDAKLGGILIDVTAQGERQAAVISFGINLAENLSLFKEPRATSLGALNDSPVESAAILFERLREALDEALSAAPDRGVESLAAELISRYRDLSAHRIGETLVWRQGDQVVEGLFRGFDEHGRLRLEVAGIVKPVSAGSLLESADDPA